jgi:hypothetical protein
MVLSRQFRRGLFRESASSICPRNSVLLVFADNDSISQKHIAEFFALLGGGVKEPGWLNTQLSRSRLAVVPGYSHYNFLTSPEVPQIVDKFLADPLTHPPGGAVAASQAAPAQEKKQ